MIAIIDKVIENIFLKIFSGINLRTFLPKFVPMKTANINGNKKPYNQVPWFWSEQYNLKLQIGGISQDHDFYVVEGNIKEEKFSVYYIKNKKLIAIDAINNQKEFMKGRKLIALDTEIPQEILQNIEGSLKNWIINQ